MDPIARPTNLPRAGSSNPGSGLSLIPHRIPLTRSLQTHNPPLSTRRNSTSLTVRTGRGLGQEPNDTKKKSSSRSKRWVGPSSTSSGRARGGSLFRRSEAGRTTLPLLTFKTGFAHMPTGNPTPTTNSPPCLSTTGTTSSRHTPSVCPGSATIPSMLTPCPLCDHAMVTGCWTLSFPPPLVLFGGQQYRWGPPAPFLKMVRSL